MSQRSDITAFALTLSGAVADRPFEDDLDTTVVRHGMEGKWFGLFMKVSGKHLGRSENERFDVMNLKIDPEESYIVREMYPASILPAYHMNKRHWISVILDGSVPNDFCEMLVGKSYDLTKPKKAR